MGVLVVGAHVDMWTDRVLSQHVHIMLSSSSSAVAYSSLCTQPAYLLTSCLVVWVVNAHTCTLLASLQLYTHVILSLPSNLFAGS